MVASPGNGHSDVESAIRSGTDTRIALIGFGTDATHGYERTRRDSLETLTRLLVAYVFSPPIFDHDERSHQPLENFEGQLNADMISGNETALPPLKKVFPGNGQNE